MSYSTAKIAKVLDLSPERIRQLERQGVLEKVHDRYELVPSVHGYIHFLRERVGVNKPATGETEAHHKLRLTKARADMAELESAEMTGDLVLLEKAEAAWTSAIGRMRQRLLAMPSKLAPVAYQAGAVAEVKAALADGIAEALMELSKVEARAVDNRGSDETGGSDDESVTDARPAAGPDDQSVGRPVAAA